MTWRMMPLALAAMLAVAGGVAASETTGPTPAAGDRDGDKVPDERDNCPHAYNPANAEGRQPDLDADGKGDACDEDGDGDGKANHEDNCPKVPNQEQDDADHDGTGDACDDGARPDPCDPSTSSSGCPPPPPGCTPDTPCSDPAFRDCVKRTNGTARGEEQCRKEYCERAHNDWCKTWACRPGSSGSACPKPTPPDEGRDCVGRAEREGRLADSCKEFCARHPDACKRFCDNHPRACAFAPRGDERHIGFEPLPDGLANLTVNGHLILSSVRMEATEEFDSEHSDGTLRIEAGDNRLELHDAASGFLRFEGATATVTLVFPEGVTHTVGEGPQSEASKVQYPGGGMAFLESEGLEWLDDRTVEVELFMAFHVVPGQFNPEGPADPQVRAKLRAALVEGDTVGGEIHVGKDSDPEVFAYDRVEIKLKHPKDRPTAEDPLVVTLSSDLPEGRTFVVHVNKSLLDDEKRLVLRYFDLPDGENGTAKTEVVFNRASSLDDILDPNDDAGQPEYYVVRDEHGLQVMVTVPHWSVHMVELSSLAELVQPSVLIGIAAGAAGIAVAAVALFVPRRRDL